MDPWEGDDDRTSGTVYDIDRVYCAGVRGERGGEIFSLRLASHIAYEIRALIEQRVVIEYGTASDFIRDAVYHRLVWAREQNGRSKQSVQSGLDLIAAEKQEVETVRGKMQQAIEILRAGPEALGERRYWEVVMQAQGIVDEMGVKDREMRVMLEEVVETARKTWGQLGR